MALSLLSLEIIVVDDCSNDGSAEIVEDFIASHDDWKIRLMRRKKNQGKGAAIRTAIGTAEGVYSDFNRWMAETIEPWVGSRVLEIGAGMGNLTRQLCPNEACTSKHRLWRRIDGHLPMKPVSIIAIARHTD